MSSESDAWFKTVIYSGGRKAVGPTPISEPERKSDLLTLRASPSLWWVVIDEPDRFVAISAPGQSYAAFAYVKKE